MSLNTTLVQVIFDGSTCFDGESEDQRQLLNSGIGTIEESQDDGRQQHHLLLVMHLCLPLLHGANTESCCRNPIKGSGQLAEQKMHGKLLSQTTFGILFWTVTKGTYFPLFAWCIFGSRPLFCKRLHNS